MIRGVESGCCPANIAVLFLLAVLLTRQNIHAQNPRITKVTPTLMHGTIMPTKLALGAELPPELLANVVAVEARVLVTRVVREVVEVLDVVDVGEKCAVEHQEAVECTVVRDVGLGTAVPISDGIGMDQGSLALQ